MGEKIWNGKINECGSASIGVWYVLSWGLAANNITLGILLKLLTFILASTTSSYSQAHSPTADLVVTGVARPEVFGVNNPNSTSSHAGSFHRLHEAGACRLCYFIRRRQ